MYLGNRSFLIPLSLAVSLLSPAPAFSSTTPGIEEKYQDARNNYYSLLSSPERLKDRSEWLRAIGKYQAAMSSGGRGADALYTIGLLYENTYKRFNQRDDGEMALGAFGRLAKKFPASALAGAADRHIGDIRFLQRKYGSAEKSYSSAYKRSVGKSAAAAGAAKGDYSGARITDIKRYSHEGYTRFVIYLSEKTAYRADRLTNPDRVFVDLLRAVPAASLPKREAYKSGLARSFRLGKSGAITRIVFDLNQGAYHSITPLSNPSRVIVDFGLNPPPKAAVAMAAPQPQNPIAPDDGVVAAPSPPAPSGGGIKTIVIDPGHGGKDPGAIGPTGLMEKRVTLAVAQKLAAILQEKLHARIILTRDRDTSLELDDRTVLANSVNADLFVSIHANSSRNRSAEGTETYFLSPARSQDELATAARENMIANLSENPAENDIAYIMSDMQSAQKINESALLARTVQKAMVRDMASATRSHGKGVKQAMFYVLWRATMPSILVETNFISNPRQERLFQDDAYLTKVAVSIADGVMEYAASYQLAMNN